MSGPLNYFEQWDRIIFVQLKNLRKPVRGI